MSKGETFSSLLSTLTRRKLSVETMILSLEKVNIMKTIIYMYCTCIIEINHEFNTLNFSSIVFFSPPLSLPLSLSLSPFSLPLSLSPSLSLPLSLSPSLCPPLSPPLSLPLSLSPLSLPLSPQVPSSDQFKIKSLKSIREISSPSPSLSRGGEKAEAGRVSSRLYTCTYF